MANVADIVRELKEFHHILGRNFSIQAMYLYGSYAKGSATPYSDIDVAVVSKDFQGITYFDRQKLNRFIINFDERLELHPFRPDDFTEENPFAAEIIRTGIKIA